MQSTAYLEIENPDSLLSSLFHLRAKNLLSNQSSVESNSILSGLFIGLELLGSKEYWYEKDVVLIGSNYLNRYYDVIIKDKVNSIIKIDSSNMTVNGLTFFKNNLNFDNFITH